MQQTMVRRFLSYGSLEWLSTSSLKSTTTTGSGANTTASEKSKSSKRVKKNREGKKKAKANDSSTSPLSNGTAKSSNEKCVFEFIQQLNAKELPDKLHLGATLVTDSGQTLPLNVFFDSIGVLTSSFEDFHIDLREIYEDEDGDVIAVVVSGGHHTGLPFQTTKHPTPLQASGTYCQLDPEQCRFTMRGGKIVKMQVIPKGKVTGFDGFYELLLKATTKKEEKHRKGS